MKSITSFEEILQVMIIPLLRARSCCPDRARTLGTRLFVSPDTWDQVLRKVPSVDRVPNRARTLGTGLFVSPDTWDQVLRILSQFSL